MKMTEEDRKWFNKMHDRELWAEKNKGLIGKRARFKNPLPGYCHGVWGKAGVIITSDRTPYLYLKFDEPYRAGLEGSMVTEALIINEGSIEVIN
jgi:hypothetical protein